LPGGLRQLPESMGQLPGGKWQVSSE
jgi:hypothetical protein